MVEAVRHSGTIGFAGLYGGKVNGFPIGDIFIKGVTIKGRPALMHNYLYKLLKYIQDGSLVVKDIISHRLPLTDAHEGYQLLPRKEDNCVKVMFDLT